MEWEGNNRVFKTYVKGNPEGDGKAPMEKVKGRPSIRTFENAANYECFGAVLDEDFVDISFDDKEMYSQFLNMAEANEWKCLALPSPNGGHTYWKNTTGLITKGGKDKKLAVGFVADIHNKSTYIPLRVHGVDRFPPDYDILEGEDYQEVPEELLPVSTKMTLWQMKNGHGRNEQLYSYILVLQGQIQAGKETIKRILKNTNSFVFAEPLEEQEIETVLRDDAFKKPIFFLGNSFLFDKFAIFLVNNDHVIKINNQLHIYKDGVYVQGKSAIEAAMIKHIPGLNRTKRTEVLEYLNVYIQENRTPDADYVAFENGIYNVTDGSFSDFSPQYIVTNKIRWNYNPKAYHKPTDELLDRITCNDKEIRSLMEEMIGYCFYRKNELRKAFILVGDGSNGKSTFLAIIQSLLDEDNISSLDLKELGDRFKTAEMFGKLANIGDDIGDEFIANAATFKKLTTGERVSVERKGRDPFEFNNYAKLIFSANDIPRIKDKTGAVIDRLVIVPFNAKFDVSKSGYKQDIRGDFVGHEEVMEYLINLGLAGLNRILQAQKFTTSAKVQNEVDDYKQRNNPILGFITECEDEEFQIENEPTNKVYKRYQEYCLANSLQPMSNIEFSKQINRALNFKVEDKKINGKKRRIFVSA